MYQVQLQNIHYQIQVSAAGHALAEYRVGVVIVTRNEKPVSNLYETVWS